MSYTYIPTKVKSELWFKAHGRCEICNKPLYRDGLTMQQVNLSEYAHIIADSPKGPRGDETLSPLLAKDESNLILLCKDHHKLIDDAGGVAKYGVDLLRKYKRDHEERINIVTGISPEKRIRGTGTFIHAYRGVNEGIKVCCNCFYLSRWAA